VAADASATLSAHGVPSPGTSYESKPEIVRYSLTAPSWPESKSYTEMSTLGTMTCVFVPDSTKQNSNVVVVPSAMLMRPNLPLTPDSWPSRKGE